MHISYSTIVAFLSIYDLFKFKSLKMQAKKEAFTSQKCSFISERQTRAGRDFYLKCSVESTYCKCKGSINILMLTLEDQQAMVFTRIIKLTAVRSINTFKGRGPICPEMYFWWTITHLDATIFGYWSSVIKHPMTSDLFPLNPNLNDFIVGNWY